MLPTPLHSAPSCWWHLQASGVLFCWEFFFRHVICEFYLFFLSVIVPSKIQKLPPDPLVRGFPGVWKLPLLRLPSQDGSLSLTLLSLFLSFIFCPTSFWRHWAAFLGVWCPLLVIRSCFVEFAQRSMIFQWICGGESDLPVWFVCQLSSLLLIFIFITHHYLS